MSTTEKPTQNQLEILDEDDLFEDFNNYKTKEVDDSQLHWEDNWEDEGADEFTNQIRATVMKN